MKKVLILGLILAALCTLALTSPQPIIMTLSSPSKTAVVQKEADTGIKDNLDQAQLDEQRRIEEERIAQEEHDRQGDGSLDAAGLPDGFGYRYSDNSLPGDTATFGWIELCGDPNATDATGTGDEGFTTVTVGWPFPFYGTNYTSFTYQVNGWIQFGSTTNPNSYTPTCPWASLTHTYPIIAAYYRDQYAGYTGSGCNGNNTAPWMRHRDFGDKFVVEWKVDQYGSTTIVPYTYEAILYPDGKIKLQYNFTPPASATGAIGIDGTVANQGVQYACGVSPSWDLNAKIVPGRAVWFFVAPVLEHDFATLSVSSPVAGTRYDPGASVPVTAIVKNFGSTTEPSTVSYALVGGPVVSEVTAALAQGTTETHTFATPVTLPMADGTYTLKVWTDLAGEMDRTNDTASVSITVLNCNMALPFSEGFESVTTPNLLPCWARENIDNNSYQWISYASYAHGGTKDMYSGSTSLTVPTNDWLYTPGLQLTGGVQYLLKYWYRSYSASTTNGPTYEVMFGQGQTAGAMTNPLVASSRATLATYTQVIAPFTPPSTGNYNVGFHVTTSYYGLILDDIQVVVAPLTGRCCYLDANHHSACADNLQADCDALGGTWTASLSCATDPCTVGRCCYANFGGCGDNMQQAECNYLAGTWTAGLTCAAAPCPQVNDACAGAIQVNIPSSTQFTNVGATDETPIICTVSAPHLGMWYKVVGNDNRLTASTCNAYGTLSDTKILVYSGTCDNLVCVGGNDDATCSFNGLRSTVTWCSDMGVTYYILVGSYGTTGGTIELDILNGDNCHIDCSTYTACGTPTETEPNNTCPTAVDPFVLSGCDLTVYGTICPLSDVDYYSVVIPPMTVFTISIFDGDNCSTTPTGVATMDLLNDDCTVSSSGQHSGFAINNSAADPVYKKVKIYGNGSAPAKYKLTTTCCSITDYAANPITIHGGELHFSTTVNTCCATRSVPFVWSSACAGSQYTAGPSVIFRFDLTYAGVLNFTAAATSDDQVMVFTNLADPTGSCVGSADATSYPELISNLALAPGTYYVSVSMYSSSSCGNITLTIDSDVPLPVTLMNPVVAKAGDGSVALEWATRSETANDHFEIVRDGRVVGRVDGAGTSATPTNYRWVDAGLSNGTTYTYSLRSVSIEGASYELGTVSSVPSYNAAEVTEYALHQNYPNPFNPTTSIAVDLVEAGRVSLKVYNLMGQEVASLVNSNLSSGRHIVSFDASSLSSGIYLYRVSVNGFSAEKKMLLMK